MKKSNTILILLIGAITIFSIGTTYAFLNINANSNNQTGQSGCFEINYTGTIGKYDSINDELESSDTYTGPYENDTGFASVKFSKASSCKIYDKLNIKLHTNSETSLQLLKEGALKYRVVNSSNNSEYWDGEIKTTSTTSSELDTTLAPNVALINTEKTYKIYLWVDTSISHNSNYNYDGLKYSGYIYADTTQSSTIKN